MKFEMDWVIIPSKIFDYICMISIECCMSLIPMPGKIQEKKNMNDIGENLWQSRVIENLAINS
jgi:hypothetical protein